MYCVIVDLDRYGERWGMLLDEWGMPVFYPTLFNTCKLRNAGKSTSTQEQYLTSIKWLLEFCDGNHIDLIQRILSKKFLTTGELDRLSDACRIKKRGVKQNRVVSLRKGYIPPVAKVDDATHRIYLHRIADYVKWLCELLLGSDLYLDETNRAVEALVKSIKTRTRTSASRIGDDTVRGMTDAQEIQLFEILRPRSNFNPWTDPGVRIRNYLIAKLLDLTGARGGEILNVRTTDIDWEAGMLKIVRRADSKQDSRRRQPRAKTNQRAIPLTPETLEEIRTYIVGVRKHIPNAAAHSYLFVAHKSGPTQGKALSLSSLQAMFSTIRSVAPELDISAHDLRHRWNWRYSEVMEHQQQIGYEEAEAMRNLLGGWKPGSPTPGRIYNKRHIKKTADEAMLTLAHQREREMEELNREQKAHGSDDLQLNA